MENAGVSRLSGLAGKIARLGVIGSSASIMIMMVSGIVDIVSSQIFKAPVLVAYELVGMSLVAAVWLAAAQSQYMDRQIAITVLTARLRRRAGSVVRLVSYLVALALGVSVVWISWPMLVQSIVEKQVVPTGIPIAMYPARLSLLIGAVLFTFICAVQAVSQAVVTVNLWRGKDELAARPDR
ncbi:MAG: TRAP transporter small permease subunit [Chloroflexi bacterium]|nr:TRAP transporter small permease subunit [Chloroflexota bacterium]